MAKVKLDTKEDLFELLRKLPEKEKLMALDVIMRLQDGKIDNKQAADEIEKLFLECGLSYKKTLM